MLLAQGTLEASINIICRMHTIYAFTLPVLMIAALLYVVALHFCSGKTIPIKIPYERQHILTAENATVGQTTVGIYDFNFIKMMKTQNVLDMFTRGTFANAQKSSACAVHSPVKLLRYF